MNVTQSQVSALYVTLFGRAGEGSGNKYWQYVASSQNLTPADIANSMLNSAPAKEFFGSNLDSDEKFIAHIYKTTLNKDANSDAEGKAFWLNALKNGTDRGTMVAELLKAATDPKYANSTDAATKAAHNLLVNKIMTSDAVADAIQNLPAGNQAIALKAFQEANDSITANSTIEEIKAAIKSKMSSLGLDSTELENSLSSASKARIIAKITGKSEKQVEEELKPKDPETLKVSVAKFLEDSVKPENANNKFIIEDKTKAINDKMAEIVAKADKITSLTSSENQEAIKLTKEQFNKLTADKLSKENTIEVSELEKTDKELALNDKVDSFKLKEGNLLEVNAEEFGKLKNKAGENSFALKDTAANIAAKLADIASDANKAKIKNIDVSDNKVLEITKDQYASLKDKFAADDKLKVTGLDENDIDIAKSDKVAEFKMQEGKSLNVTIAELEALKDKANGEVFGVIDSAEKFTSSNVGALEVNINKIKIIKTTETTKQEITVPKSFMSTINKFAPDEKLKVTGVENADEAKTLALKSQVKSFVLKSDVTSLTIKAEDFKTIASKISDNGKLDIKDTAANIASKLADIANDTTKAKIKGIDISDTNALELTKDQYNSLKDKFANDDNLKVIGIENTDADKNIVKEDKVKSFTLKSDVNDFDVKADEFKAIAGKITDSGKINVKDTAAVIKDKIADIANVATKDKIKAIDSTDNAEITLSQDQYKNISDKVANDEVLKITDVTGAVAASNAKDTFVLKSDAAGLNITNFSADDKVSFKNLGVTEAGNLNVATGSNQTIDTGKLYLVNMNAAIASKDYANTDFGDLFATGGKAFNTTVSGAVNSIVLVKGSDSVTQIYKVSSNDTTIDQSEVTLVGTVKGDALDSATDILFN